MITLWIIGKGACEFDYFFIASQGRPFSDVLFFLLNHRVWTCRGGLLWVRNSRNFGVQCGILNFTITSKSILLLWVMCKTKTTTRVRFLQNLSCATTRQAGLVEGLCLQDKQVAHGMISVLIALVVIILLFPFGTDIPQETGLYLLSGNCHSSTPTRLSSIDNGQLWLGQFSSIYSYVLERKKIHE